MVKGLKPTPNETPRESLLATHVKKFEEYHSLIRTSIDLTAAPKTAEGVIR